MKMTDQQHRLNLTQRDPAQTAEGGGRGKDVAPGPRGHRHRQLLNHLYNRLYK